MNEAHNLFGTLQNFDPGNGRQGALHSLRQLESAGVGPVSRLPVSIRLVLEAVLRNCDGKRVLEENVRALANWKPTGPRTEEIPFVVARIVLQDFTGVPLLVDLAAACAGGFGGGSLGAGGLLRHAGCHEPEPGAGVQAQP
jgi:aconitate hydratase